MAQVRVNPGDNLWKIAKANPVPGKSVTERIREIAAASGITDPNKIKPGMVLIVPGGPEGPPVPRARPDPAALSAARQTDTRGPMPARGGARPEGPAGGMPRAKQRIAPPSPPITKENVDSLGLAMNMGNDRQWTERATGPLRPQASPPPAPYGRAPEVGNLNYPDPMAAALMAQTDFSQADPPSSAGQVMNLPEGMNTAAFPDSGAETPATDALAPSPTAGVPGAVIGPQFDAGTFAETPSGSSDPHLAALLADPIKRQMLVQALMQPGGGM